jgi:hypothetical protein
MLLQDPDYKLSLQVANWQREDLEEQYPLCEDCVKKVENVLKEKNIPAASRVDEEDDSWLDLIPDPEPVRLAQKPSVAFAFLSRTRGFMWHMSHLSSVAIYMIGMCLGRTLQHNVLLYVFTDDTLSHLAIWNPAAVKGYLIKGGQSPFSVPLNAFKDMEWEYWQYCTVFSLASLYWMDWEPLTLRWYGHDRVQLHNFWQYKVGRCRAWSPFLHIYLTSTITRLPNAFCLELGYLSRC